MGTGPYVTEAFDEFVKYVFDALYLRRRLIERRHAILYSAPSDANRFGWLTRRSAADLASRDPTMRLPEPLRGELIQVANDEIRSWPQYDQIVSEYWLESVAVACCQTFSLDSAAVSAFERIAATRTNVWSWERVMSARWWIGAVAALVGAFVTFIPSEVLSPVGVSAQTYNLVRLIVAAIVLILVASVATATTLASSLAERREAGRSYRQAMRLVPIVLMYCSMYLDHTSVPRATR